MRVVRFYVSLLRLQLLFFLLVVLRLLRRRAVCAPSSSSCCQPSAGPQPRPPEPSVPCRTSTATLCAQCSLPDLNRDSLRSVFPAGPRPRDRMSERMSEDMSERMSGDMSERMSDRMSGDMSERMSDNMPE